MTQNNNSNTNQNDDLIDPLLTSDPLVNQKSKEEDIRKKTPVDFGSDKTIDYSLPENKELARKQANELMDQGKFAEAAKILKESGIHQTVTPKPEEKKPVPGAEKVPTPPTEQVQAPTGTPAPPSAEPVPPAKKEQPEAGQPKAEQPIPAPPVVEKPVEPPSQVLPKPTPSPAVSPFEDSVPPPTEVAPPAAEPKAPEPPRTKPEPPAPPSPPQAREAPPATPPEVPSILDQPLEEEHPDDYLKKAYDLRKELIEYDRTKVNEEEKLQTAEELVFEGNKEKAIELYRQVAKEAEEKKEREVAIEAYERLAALLR